MELLSFLVIAVFLLLIYLWLQTRGSNLPPAPVKPYPVVGHLFHIKSNSRPQFKEWWQKCGDIYRLQMGSTLVVVLNGFDLMKEALVKKADFLSDRPPFFINDAIGMREKGIIISSGENWKEQRTVTLSILRSFGMGKNLLAEKIQEEVSHFIDYLSSLKGKPTNLRVMTNVSTSNVICSILIGHRFEYSDKDFQALIQKLNSLLADQQNVSIINFMYWLKYLPGDLFLAKKLASHFRDIMNMLTAFIQDKRRLVEDRDDICNLIDAYMIEKNQKNLAGIATYLDDQNLVKVMMDLFNAGSDTTSTTITWCLLYMLHHPDVQEKVFQEIKDKVGTSVSPTIQDKPQLNYLNAVIMETQRLASIVPQSVTHMSSEEVTLRGFTIPKGTYVIPNLDSVLHDPATWGDDVMSFKPERFINKDGSLNIPEQFIPFSIGRRICLGEAMARMELFLYLSNMFQRFKFLPATSGSPPPLTYDCGIILSPKPYEIRLVERH